MRDAVKLPEGVALALVGVCRNERDYDFVAAKIAAALEKEHTARTTTEARVQSLTDILSRVADAVGLAQYGAEFSESEVESWVRARMDEREAAARNFDEMVRTNSETQDRLSLAEARVRELEADAARLDWLERNSGKVAVFDPPSGDAWVWEACATDDDNKPCEPMGQGGTLREAIDAARQAGEVDRG